jgi:hypothetical protein
VSEINSDELVRCPLCGGDGFLTHADKSTTACPLCQGRRLLHEEFVAACRDSGTDRGCDYRDHGIPSDNGVRGLHFWVGVCEVTICYACWLDREGIVLPVYEAGEAEPF